MSISFSMLFFSFQKNNMQVPIRMQNSVKSLQNASITQSIKDNVHGLSSRASSRGWIADAGCRVLCRVFGVADIADIFSYSPPLPESKNGPQPRQSERDCCQNSTFSPPAGPSLLFHSNPVSSTTNTEPTSMCFPSACSAISRVSFFDHLGLFCGSSSVVSQAEKGQDTLKTGSQDAEEAYEDKDYDTRYGTNDNSRNGSGAQSST